MAERLAGRDRAQHRQCRIGNAIPEMRREPPGAILVLHRKPAEGRLERARRAKRVPAEWLRGTHRDRVAERGVDAHALGGVVLRRAGAMEIEIFDVARRIAIARERLLDRYARAVSLWIGRREVIAVGRLTPSAKLTVAGSRVMRKIAAASPRLMPLRFAESGLQRWHSPVAASRSRRA